MIRPTATQLKSYKFFEFIRYLREKYPEKQDEMQVIEDAIYNELCEGSGNDSFSSASWWVLEDSIHWDCDPEIVAHIRELFGDQFQMIFYVAW